MVVQGTNGRSYEVDERGRATLIQEARCYYCDYDEDADVCEGCSEDFAAQAEAECYAEFGSSYVLGGGRTEDVAAAWRQFGRDTFG